VKSKWIFDIKRSGLFKVRLVACGYSQIPGVDFTESYAPVINDVSWRILIIAMLVQKLEAKICDVSTAFSYGDLEEDIYIYIYEVRRRPQRGRSTAPTSCHLWVGASGEKILFEVY